MKGGELSRLNNRATKLLKKMEDKSYELNDVEISIISNIGRAKNMNDVNWLALTQFERLCLEWKV